MTPGRTSFGDALRTWRMHRRMSQLELAARAAVSTKHLSFLETGRAKPSPEMVVHLAEHLDVPIRERNALLLAAGHAPRYGETPLDAEAMAAARRAIEMILEHHQPFPAVVIDRQWNLVAANPAAMLLSEGVAPEVLEPPVNVVRLSLHPLGLAPRVRNLAEFGGYLLERLRHQAAATADAQLSALVDELTPYLPAGGSPPSPSFEVLLPFVVELDGTVLSLFTTITTFGTPLDVTTAELAVESFFPADDLTEAWFRSR